MSEFEIIKSPDELRVIIGYNFDEILGLIEKKEDRMIVDCRVKENIKLVQQLESVSDCSSDEVKIGRAHV